MAQCTGVVPVIEILLENGVSLSLTDRHLVYVATSKTLLPGSVFDSPVVAEKVKPGHYIYYVVDDTARNDTENGLRLLKVISVNRSYTTKGVYAPLTASGNVVVNGVAASCYAEHHTLGQLVFKPLIFWYSVWNFLGFGETTYDASNTDGYFHPYAKALAQFGEHSGILSYLETM